MQLVHSVLDDEGLHHLDTSTNKPEWCTIPVDTDSIKNAGDIIDLAYNNQLEQIWILPGSTLSQRVTTLDDDFVTACLDNYDIHPCEMASYLQGWKKGTHGQPQSICFTEYMDSIRLTDIRNYKDLYATITYIRIVTGINFAYTAGNGAMSILRQGNKTGERSKYLEYPTVDLSIFYDNAASEIKWTRPLSDKELQFKYLVHIDANSDFLSVCKDVRIGQGDYKHEVKPGFNRKVPGRWHVEISGSSVFDGDMLPHPTYKVTRGWFDTSVVQSLVLCGYQIEVLEAYLFRLSHNTMKPLYDKLGTAITLLQTDTSRFKNETARLAALDTVKRMYKRGIGLLGYKPLPSQKTYWYHRPDMRNAIVEASNNRMMWHIINWYNSGAILVGINVDDLFFLSDSPNPEIAVPGLRISNDIGSFKHKFTYPIEDVKHCLVGDIGRLMNGLSKYRKEG